MPRKSTEHTQSRKNEIINSCKKLYETLSFEEITLKEISKATSFSRPSIYNYFQTKEEIFLAIFQDEYELWTAELHEIENKRLPSRTALAKEIAKTLENRTLLLKLLSMNLYDMEENSRKERLVAFKGAYKASFEAVENLLKIFCADFSPSRRKEFLLSFFPFIFGVYPYSFVTEKQREAMEESGMECPNVTIYELVYKCVKRLLSD